MKIQKLLLFFFLGLVMSLGYACGDDDESEEPPPAFDCAAVEVSYAMDIVPITSETCAIPNCHVSGFAFGDYTSYDDLRLQFDRGLLRDQISTRAMPPQNTAGPTELTDLQLATFLCWIDQGALDN